MKNFRRNTGKEGEIQSGGKTGIWIRSRVKHTLAKCVAGLHMSISLNGIDLKIDLR